VLASLVGRPLFWVALIAALAGPLVVSSVLRRPLAVPEVLGTLPPFELQGTDGARFDGPGLKGRVWVLGFVDASCLACAERLGKALETLQYRLRNVGSAAGMLEVVVPSNNPVVSFPDELTHHHANPRLWHVAEGSDARRLLAEVGALAPLRGPMLEAGGALALVDGQGRVRAVEGTEAPGALDGLVAKMTLILNIQ
jgi:hypothetical protein